MRMVLGVSGYKPAAYSLCLTKSQTKWLCSPLMNSDKLTPDMVLAVKFFTLIVGAEYVDAPSMGAQNWFDDQRLKASFEKAYESKRR